jgi:hypothetical protein
MTDLTARFIHPNALVKKFIDACFRNKNLGEAFKALGELVTHFGTSLQGILILVGVSIALMRYYLVGICIIVAGVTSFSARFDRFIQQDDGQSMVDEHQQDSFVPPIYQINPDPELESLRRQYVINQMRNRPRTNRDPGSETLRQQHGINQSRDRS